MPITAPPKHAVLVIAILLIFLVLLHEENVREKESQALISSSGALKPQNTKYNRSSDDSGSVDVEQADSTTKAASSGGSPALDMFDISSAMVNTSTLAILSKMNHLTSNSATTNMTGSYWGSWWHGNSTMIYTSNATASSALPRKMTPAPISVRIGVPEEDVKQCTVPTTVYQQFFEKEGVLLIRITKFLSTIAFSTIMEVRGHIYICSSSDWSTPYFQAPFHGLYFSSTGQLTFFTNAKKYQLYVGARPVGFSNLEKIKQGNYTLSAEPYTNVSRLESDILAEQKEESHTLSSSFSERQSHSTPILRFDMKVTNSDNKTLHKGHISESLVLLTGTVTAPFNNKIQGGKSSSGLSLLQLKLLASGMHVDFDKLLADARFYGFLETIACVVQAGFHFRFIRTLGEPALLRATSELTFFLLAGLDVLLCLTHLVAATMIDELFSWFMLVSLLKFIIFSSEFKLIFRVWHSRHPQDDLTGPSGQQFRNRIYARFYCALLLGSAAVYHMAFLALPAFTLLAFTHILPQIFANEFYNAPQAMMRPQKFYFFASLTRLFIPIYFWGFGSKIFELYPLGKSAIDAIGSHAWLLLFLLAWVGVQMVLLVYQSNADNIRVFMPNFLLPKRHNYRPLFTSEDIEFGAIGTCNLGSSQDRQCAICMNSVEILLDAGGKPGYMVTPCNHWFHAECLSRWFQTGSLNCPVCRQECPPE